MAKCGWSKLNFNLVQVELLLRPKLSGKHDGVMDESVKCSQNGLETLKGVFRHKALIVILDF